MRYSAIAVVYAAIVPILLSGAEPSAFGAGDLDNSSPYGLTSTEKVILQNKDKLHKVVVKSNNQANEVDSLRERIDGLQSIIENLSRQAHNNKVTLKKIETLNDENFHNSDEYSKRLGDVVQKNVQNIEELKIVISQLSVRIDAIEKEYVNKEEFNALVQSVNLFKTLVAKELKGSSSSQNASSKVQSIELYNRAKKMFNKKYYTKSISDYKVLISRNYKPAYSHYMIGEMNFKRRNYAQAITYFKKSSSLYSKANYMPNLMLHSAISMDKTGDKEHAKAFYNAIVSKYPNTKESREAKKYLDL